VAASPHRSRPLWTRLTHGATRAELSEFLWREVEDHLGLDPVRCGTDRFADLLLAWAAAGARVAASDDQG
jgi:hypothetical protein